MERGGERGEEKQTTERRAEFMDRPKIATAAEFAGGNATGKLRIAQRVICNNGSG